MFKEIFEIAFPYISIQETEKPNVFNSKYSGKIEMKNIHFATDSFQFSIANKFKGIGFNEFKESHENQFQIVDSSIIQLKNDINFKKFFTIKYFVEIKRDGSFKYVAQSSSKPNLYILNEKRSMVVSQTSDNDFILVGNHSFSSILEYLILSSYRDEIISYFDTLDNFKSNFFDNLKLLEMTMC